MSPVEHVALIAVLALATGATSKFADLLNEHGVVWFRHASIASGLVWAALAGALTLTDPVVAALWLGTVLYWFLVLKLDHINHALAGVVVVICGLWMSRDEAAVPFWAVVGILGWLTLSGVVNRHLKSRDVSRAFRAFLRVRVRYYAGPFVLAFAFGTILPAIAILFGMLGTEAVTILHSRLSARGRPWEGLGGLRYVPELDVSR